MFFLNFLLFNSFVVVLIFNFLKMFSTLIDLVFFSTSNFSFSFSFMVVRFSKLIYNLTLHFIFIALSNCSCKCL